MNNDQLLRKYCRENNTHEALRLLHAGADPLFNQATAVFWMAKHNNTDLLDACSDVMTTSGFDPTPILITLLPSVSFLAYFDQWHQNMSVDGRITLLSKMIMESHSDLKKVWRDFDVPSSSFLNKVILDIARSGQKNLIEFVHPYIKPDAHIGVIEAFLEHDLVDDVKKVMPSIVWSSKHHDDVCKVFWHQSNIFEDLKQYIPQNVIQSCAPILQTQLPYNEKHPQALIEVTDQKVVLDCLCHWIFKQDTVWCDAFIKNNSIWRQDIHSLGSKLNQENLMWIEGRAALVEHQLLEHETQKRQEGAFVGMKKKM